MTEVMPYNGGAREVAHLAPAPMAPAAVSLVAWAQEASAAHALAENIVGTAFCPQQYRNKPMEAAAAMLAGAELGFNPMASLRCFDNIQGVTAPKAITQVAVAQSHGHDVEVVSESDEKVIVRGRRRGGEWQSLEWTVKHAQDLGLLGKDNWKKQRRTMLVARGLSAMARRVAADALLGIPYCSEELRDEDPAAMEWRETQPRVTIAEITGQVAPEDAGPAVATAAQLRTLNGLLRDNGITQKALALALYADVTGREVEASKALTPAEADAVIARLTEMRDAPVDAEPAEDPDPGWADVGDPPADADTSWPEAAKPGSAS